MTTSPLAWDESGKSAHWRNRDIKINPFSLVFNFMLLMNPISGRTKIIIQKKS